MASALQHSARRQVAHQHEDSDAAVPDEGTFSDTVINPRMRRVKRRRLEDPTLQTLVADGAFGGIVPLMPRRTR
jgi:hypothetical protein